MKRTAIRRKTALRQGGELSRGGSLRRTRLRRKPPEPRTERERLLSRRWWEAVAKNRSCVVCGKPNAEGHHVIDQQVLERRARELGLDELDVVWDPDGGMAVCGGGFSCHARHTAAFRRIPRAKIPARTWAFAERLGLTWWVLKEYPA